MSDDLRTFPDDFVPNIQASDAFKRWARSSPADRARWEAFRDALLADPATAVVPTMSTRFGKALAAAGKEHMSISALVGLPVPPYPPVPPVTAGYFVSTTGSDLANGSQSAPWRTVLKACQSVPANQGHVVSIAAGTYDESATLEIPSGTSFVGAGSAATVIRPTSTFTPLMRVQSNTQPVVLSDFRLDGVSKTRSRQGLIAQNTLDVDILRLDVRGFTGAATPTWEIGGGIHINGGSGVEVGYCNIEGNAGVATYVSGEFGIGSHTGALIHDTTIISPNGYCVKSTGGALVNCTFYNLTVTAQSATASSWDTIAFELSPVDATNCVIRNCTINRPLSLGDNSLGPLGSGFRWHIHNNHFPVASGYALELNFHSCEVDHNFFNGGGYACAAFTGSTKQGNKLHHNVYDNQYGPAICALQTGTWDAAQIYENTVVNRSSADGFNLRDGIYSFGEAVGYTGSDGTMSGNIFRSVPSIGDKLGLGLGGFTIDGNWFYNISTRGTNASTGDPGMPLTGGFPTAYVPTGGATSFGALADGTFTVGPQ